MDELTQKNELVRAMTATELALPLAEEEFSVQKYSKIPLSRIAALGTGLEPVTAAIQHIVSGGQAVSGYYKVTIPPGTHLASFKDGTGFLGTAMGNTGIESQARLNPLICDPTMLLVAMTLANIDKKLDVIQDVKKQLAKVQDEFKEYQLALYLYAFGYFLEVLLQENFDTAYLESVSRKVDDMSFQYRELYFMSYERIEGYTKSLLQSKVVGGLPVMNKIAGETIAKYLLSVNLRLMRH